MIDKINMSPTLNKQNMLSQNVGWASEWMLRSGIQDLRKGEASYGGVNAWFDVTTQSYPFVYSEITGYAVNFFLHFFDQTGQDDYVKAAKLSADCLLRNRDPYSHLVFNRIRHKGFEQAYYETWVFMFDQWVIVYGLISLYEVTKEPIYKQASEEIAGFLIENTLRPEGDFYPVYDFEKKEKVATNDKWSRQPGSFHAKALMALDALFRVTQNFDYQNVANNLLEITLKKQQNNGRFVTQDSDQSTHLHPHLYTLEGLLSYGLARGDGSAIKAAKRGVEWVLSHQDEKGSIKSIFHPDGFLPFVRCDILAQTLRVAAVLKGHGYLKGFDDSLSRLKSALLRYQVKEGPQKGGFYYGQEQDGTIHYHLNAWVTMFAAQGLWAYEQIQNNKDPYVMQYFV